VKTLFLFALLAILVAFAFKEPSQSAWDYARTVGTRISSTVALENKDEFKPKPEAHSGAPANEDLRTFNDHLSRVENIIATEPTKSAPRRRIAVKTTSITVAKPQSGVGSKKDIEKENGTKNSVITKTAKEPKLPKISIEPAPGLDPKPVAKVAREEISPPRSEIPNRPAYRPINVDELAEMGRRYDRASRLLSEIK
jgi:hypothetical protein